jgi:hypothetical protein
MMTSCRHRRFCLGLSPHDVHGPADWHKRERLTACFSNGYFFLDPASITFPQFGKIPLLGDFPPTRRGLSLCHETRRQRSSKPSDQRGHEARLDRRLRKVTRKLSVRGGSLRTESSKPRSHRVFGVPTAPGRSGCEKTPHRLFSVVHPRKIPLEHHTVP